MDGTLAPACRLLMCHCQLYPDPYIGGLTSVSWLAVEVHTSGLSDGH